MSLLIESVFVTTICTSLFDSCVERDRFGPLPNYRIPQNSASDQRPTHRETCSASAFGWWSATVDFEDCPSHIGRQPGGENENTVGLVLNSTETAEWNA